MAESVERHGERLPGPEVNYRALLEQIPAVTYINGLDETGSKLYVSPQIEAILGFSSADWLADPQLWFKQVHPDDRKRVLAEIQSSWVNDKPFSSQYRLLTRDGRVVWVRDEALLVRDESGEPCFIQGVMYDITKRLRVESALRENEARFRAIYEGAAVGIALVDMGGRLLESNRTLQDMLGFSGRDLKDRVFAEFTYPEDKISEAPLYKDLVEGKRDHYRLEKRYIRKDGSLVWSRLNVSFAGDDEGEPEFTIHMVEDITEQKRLENQFLQSQKMETVGRLAGSIAHDFNNLLTIIKGYSQLAMAEHQNGTRLRESIREIEKATDNASALTRQLLAFSRRQVMEVKIIDLNILIKNLEKMLRRVIGEDIEMTVHLAENLGRVRTDPAQIEHVILNLTVNARDAMPAGGKLTLQTRNVELDEDYARSQIGVSPGNYVIILVGDTGCGMPPEVRERIFEPFFTTKEKGKGTGLGLSTVYGIVKQSGGHILVYSEPGHGATFEIYLPRVEEGMAVKTPPEQSQSGDLPRGNEIVIVVEDEPSLRALAAYVLRKQGYTVLEAANGEQAMQIASQSVVKEIDLLVTDVVMPHMGGKELAKRFKVIYPSAKILYISGYLDRAFPDQASFEPEVPFLEKPFSPEDLVKEVREVLDSPPPKR
jgi:two-component system, cell cycle sensor histidine kinase and response regulator CckA